MNRNLICFFPLLFFSLFSRAQVTENKVVAGYLTISKQHPFDWDNLEYKNLTHIILSFMEPVSATDPALRYHGPEDVFAKYDLKEKTFFGFASRLIAEAHKNKVKVILGLCGGNDLHASDLKGLFADDKLRSSFIQNVLATCVKYHFDGVDLDYEYPGSKQEGEGITKFTRELRDAVDKSNKLDHGRPFTITLACPKLDALGQWYDFAALTHYCDWFNIMTYGYEASFTKFAGFNCPLYPAPEAIAAGRNISVDQSMYEYFHLQRKVPLDKLVVGLGFYGWLHQDYTRLYGAKSASISLSYADIVQNYLNAPGWVYNWSDASKVPYLTNEKNKEMITYDDAISIGIKCNYAIEKGFRGVMIWELSRGYLYRKQTDTQPLLQAVGDKFKLQH
ncbi:glycoside hydrolase family 18 protein [Mucilaginibacter arboris]|uniref:chitinase n=1 Tax=Mucilaginibacter arboris TaxID=2682090 RepID=A0A7K1STT5_9SPHI|nr:glycoside hydrolase family 18 protein [Mucilaginibacter arboris]MVN20480.1 hypothetical protein [Mucilaginibacter arboris]